MRLAFLLEYNGKDFCGSQSQKNLRTVQSVLEEALTIFLGSSAKMNKPLRVMFSGRTDSGVHAAGQVAHFELPKTVEPKDLGSRRLLSQKSESDDWGCVDMEAFAWSLNGILPADVCIKQACLVPSEFHSRFNAIERHYVYSILNRAQRSPMNADTHYFIRTPLDENAMKEAIVCLPGKHDFSAFKSGNADKISPICEVKYAKLLNLGEGELEFSIAANHFVYNMIRIIVGTLVKIGLKKRPVDSLKLALVGAQRNLAGPTAPALGLSLVSVKYAEPYANIFKFANFNDRVDKRNEEILSEY
jgi:tRNA pseudouridine38-40 synthase